MHYYEKGNKLNIKKFLKVFGIFFVFTGISVFIYFFFPVISYQLFLANNYSKTIESPIPKYLFENKNIDFGTLFSSGITSLTADYTDARNWYPNLGFQGMNKPKVDLYFISIPKLKIENAEVSTRDYELEKHLVQYAGTSIPGENGTAVVFGHSTLPSLFNAKNYRTIFATLHNLKIGDEVITKVKGNEYKYKVFSINITSAQDTNMFSQTYDNSYLTLVTCTPPGTIWKRLVVRASLEM